jgi:hypothetical protein
MSSYERPRTDEAVMWGACIVLALDRTAPDAPYEATLNDIARITLVSFPVSQAGTCYLPEYLARMFRAVSHADFKMVEIPP